MVPVSWISIDDGVGVIKPWVAETSPELGWSTFYSVRFKRCNDRKRRNLLLLLLQLLLLLLLLSTSWDILPNSKNVEDACVSVCYAITHRCVQIDGHLHL